LLGPRCYHDLIIATCRAKRFKELDDLEPERGHSLSGAILQTIDRILIGGVGRSLQAVTIEKVASRSPPDKGNHIGVAKVLRELSDR
jgi:hypothetical protein